MSTHIFGQINCIHFVLELHTLLFEREVYISSRLSESVIFDTNTKTTYKRKNTNQEEEYEGNDYLLQRQTKSFQKKQKHLDPMSTINRMKHNLKMFTFFFLSLLATLVSCVRESSKSPYRIVSFKKTKCICRYHDMCPIMD